MEKIDNGDLTTNIKDRIAEILHKNEIAVNEIPKEKARHIVTNDLVSDQKQSQKSLENELRIGSSKTMLFQTNPNGIIKSVDDYFLEISGYKKFELLGQLYNIVYHPNIPDVIFNNVWTKLKKEENFLLYVKNMAKDGRHFWTLNLFEAIVDKDANLLSYHIKNKAVSASITLQVERIYNTLISIERKKGNKCSYNYLVGLLEDENCSYDASIIDVLASNIELLRTLNHRMNVRKALTKKRKDLLAAYFNTKIHKD